MGYILGILGTITLLAGAAFFLAAQTSEQQIRGLLFWVMTAVFYSGEAVIAAINRLQKRG
jgi:hypothetical protein